MKKNGVTEGLYRFGRSAIDELNRNQRPRCQTSMEIALLMVGLSMLLFLLYAMIVW
jgi:hypothetical protein